MRRVLILSSLLLCAVHPVQAQVSVGINIGVSMPVYPQLVVVPGYPVYYDPDADSNYFFYDGQYWVYADDNWYASDWYDGPWDLVEPEFVPAYVLRVPVQYYRRPPVYFGVWQRDAPPRWGEHWGHAWETRRSGWDHWDHNARPQPAPLPVYQRQFSGDRYPHAVDQQRSIRTQNYHYQPHDSLVRQHADDAAHGQREPQANTQHVNDARTNTSKNPPPSHDTRDHSPPRPAAPNTTPDRNSPDRARSDQSAGQRNQVDQHVNQPQPAQSPPVKHEVPVAPRPQAPPMRPPAPAMNANHDAGRHENAAPAPNRAPPAEHHPAPPQPHEPPHEHEHKDDGH